MCIRDRKYVTQACKTMLDDQWMVTGHNCVARASYLEMMTTKQQFRKTDGKMCIRDRMDGLQ